MSRAALLANVAFDRYSATQLGSLQGEHRGDGVDDLQVAWLIVGWMLAFWAGKDLQTRFEQWRSSRRTVRAE